MDWQHRMIMKKAHSRAPVCYDKAPDRSMLSGDPRLEPSAEFAGGFSVHDDLGTKVLAGTMAAMLILGQAAAFAPAHGPQYVPPRDWDGTLPKGFSREDVVRPKKAVPVEPLGGVASATEPKTAENATSDLLELQNAHEIDILTRADPACFKPDRDCLHGKALKCYFIQSTEGTLLQHILKTHNRFNKKTRWCGAGNPSCDRKKTCEDNLSFMERKSKKATKILRKLIKCGASLDERSIRDDVTPLMAAARGGFSSFVKTLLDSGADPMLVDNKNLTALDYALLYNLEVPTRDETWQPTHPFRCSGRYLCAKMLIKKMGWSHIEVSKELNILLNRLYPPSLYPDSDFFPGYSITNRDHKKYCHEMAMDSLFSEKERCYYDGCPHEDLRLTV
jgi:hypothetical protein